MEQMADRFYLNVVQLLPTLIWIAVVLALTIVFSRRAQGVVRRLSERTQAPREIADLLGRIARIGILLLGALVVREMDRLMKEPKSPSSLVSVPVIALPLAG